MAEAIETLYMWREENGMEISRHFDAPDLPSEYVEMCSKMTRTLNTILVAYVTVNCCERRASSNKHAVSQESMYNMIVDWMDATYQD